MDAYDIFKKLTNGAKFSKEHNPKLKHNLTKENEQPNGDISIGQIKEELLDTDIKIEPEEIKQDPDLVEIRKSDVAVGSAEPDFTESITLLTGLVTADKKRGKKRKHEDENEEAKTQRLHEEEVRHYRNVHNITVVGRRIPDPARTFEDFKVDADIISNLKKCGYEEPTPIQKQAVPLMIESRQILACAPTGSGKTAAFLTPIIQQLKGPQNQGFRAIILCPTRELAKQTQRECLKLSEGRDFRVHIISKIKQAVAQYGSRSSQKYDILITTPNRLCYLLKQSPPLSLDNLEWLVIDEADKLFEDGTRSFADQLMEILEACDDTDRRIAMFSATYTIPVAKWCCHNMSGLARVTIGQRNSATDSVDQELLYVGNEQGKLLAFRDLVRKGLNPPVLVFVQSQERAQQLFSELIYDGINVDAIHAGRTQLQRDNTVRSFREGRIWVLICTELMARGIDFKGVNLVINYDAPNSAISYIHRIGRAGRAGRKGKAITFFTTKDSINLRRIANLLKGSGCEVTDYMLKLKKLSRSDSRRMIRAAIERGDVSTAPNWYPKKKDRGNKKKQKPNKQGIKEGQQKTQKRKKKKKKNNQTTQTRKI